MFEVSALTNFKVKSVFDSLIKELIRKYKKHDKPNEKEIVDEQKGNPIRKRQIAKKQANYKKQN